MKRLYQRKLILILLPFFLYFIAQYFFLSVMGFGPEQARITDCFVRPATPLEVYKGAHFGVTMRAYSSGYATEQFHYSFAEEHIPLAVQKDRGYIEPVVKELVLGRDDSFDYSASHFIDFESNVGLRWLDSKVVNEPLAIKLTLPAIATSQFVQHSFQLDAAKIPLPEVKAIRRPNFKVTHALLSYFEHDESATIVEVTLNIANVIDEGQQSKPNPQLVGAWACNLKGIKPIESQVNWPLSTWDPTLVKGKEISKVNLTLMFDKFRFPLPPNTKIHGLLSVRGGWPQEITLEWPQGIVVEKEHQAKFSSKLVEVVNR